MPFTDFPLRPSIQHTLAAQELDTPTEIQARAIPALIAGHSVVGVAETGSGKTLAYVLPILDRLKALEDESEPVEKAGRPRAIVIVPTRELGEQVARVFKSFTHDTRLRVRAVLGGAKAEVGRRNVAGPFEVLVATPGRLIQFLEQRLVDLSDVRLAVLDEADQLLDQGFLPDATAALGACPPGRQLALFSATVPPPVEALIAKTFSNPVVIKSKGSHRLVATLKTTNREIRDGKRFDVLRAMLDKGLPGSTLLFTNTREQCDKLAQEIREAGFECSVYRGEMDKNERRANLKEFRAGGVSLLIATDLGARGLDVEGVGRVINYHLPREQESYLHRVGRTARAGRDGEVINFVTERDRPLLLKVEQLKAPRAKR